MFFHLGLGPDTYLSGLSSAVHAGSAAVVRSYFSDPSRDAPSLFEMAANRGGLKKIRVAMFPAPPGWHGRGEFWVVFHAWQTIEEDHDPVYEVRRSDTGFRLGPEVPEDDLAGAKIENETYSASLHPEFHSVRVSAFVTVKPGSSKRALPFRLNDNYQLDEPNLAVATETSVLYPKPGQLVRAGSLLIPWTTKPEKQYCFTYSAKLPASDEDEVVDSAAYVTAWWLPSLGRLPFTVHARIDAPAKWVVRGEGNALGVEVQGDRQICRFDCPMPISYPKIIAGDYQEVAKDRVGSDRFRIFQLAPIDQIRAKRDLTKMEEAASFYKKTLGPLPFHGYECYDATRYYGIESYSHTLLQRDVTHFISHEMGHTYFGGLAPCAYVHDSWNEGVTQYIDSVVLLHDQDRTLEMGFGSQKIGIPLKDMPVPWAHGSVTYYRGAYVMKMLEKEIGSANVLAALRLIASERVGKDTRWDDLRPYFEKTGGAKLDWYWNQWIDSAEFPTLRIDSFSSEPHAGGYRNFVSISQSSNRPEPMRLRFMVRLNGQTCEVQMRTGRVTVAIDTPSKPSNPELVLFPFTLASIVK